MDRIIVWVMLPLAVGAMSQFLGKTGLKRLKSRAELSLCLLWIIGVISAFIGIFWSISIPYPNAVDFRLLPILPLLSALIVTAAYIDGVTQWAPTELIFPICLLAGWNTAEQMGYPLLMKLSGILLFVFAWGCWRIQLIMDKTILPPADIVALLLPIIMLNQLELLAAFYVWLSIVIVAIKVSTSRTNIRLFLVKGRISLLAVAFPLLLSIIWAESLLFVVDIGK